MRTIDDLPTGGGRADIPAEFLIVHEATSLLGWTKIDGQWVPSLFMSFEGKNAYGEKMPPVTVVINVIEVPTFVKQIAEGLAEAYFHVGPPTR